MERPKVCIANPAIGARTRVSRSSLQHINPAPMRHTISFADSRIPFSRNSVAPLDTFSVSFMCVIIPLGRTRPSVAKSTRKTCLKNWLCSWIEIKPLSRACSIPLIERKSCLTRIATNRAATTTTMVINGSLGR